MPRRKKKKFSRHYVRLLLLVLLAVGLSLLASVHWFLDLFSHFTAHYALLCAVLTVFLLLSGRWGWSVIGLFVTAALSYQVYPLYETQIISDDDVPFEEVRILQYNVNRNNDNVNEMARWIISQSAEADIVVLFEITDKWQAVMDRIKWAYPYHIGKVVRGDRQIYILSRLLIDELEIMELTDGIPSVIIRGATLVHEIPFVLYGIHPPPPVMPELARIRNDVLVMASENMQQETLPYKILIGDFNTTRYSPWFKKMQKITKLYDSSDGQGFLSTWPSYVPKYLGISIDNMLLSNNIEVVQKQLGPNLGSDHYPVISDLKLIVRKGDLDHATIQGTSERH